MANSKVLSVTITEKGRERLEFLVKKMGKPRSAWRHKSSRNNVSGVIETLISNAYKHYTESLPMFPDEIK
jgi:DNA-binding PadR family transcriptional regulator